MTAAPSTMVSAEAFEVFLLRSENQGRLFERINGRISEKMPTEQHGELVAWIVTILNNYLVPHRLGRAGVEIRHRAPNDRHNDRLPDASVRLNLERPAVAQGPVVGMSDIAIEIKSPGDTVKSLHEAAHYCLVHGARLVLRAFLEKKLIEAWTDADHEPFGVKDTLEFGDILPGSSIIVADIFI